MKNLNVVSVVALMAGGILLYSAAKHEDPRDVVRKAFKLPAKYTKKEIGVARGLLPPTGGGGGTPHFTLDPNNPNIDPRLNPNFIPRV